MQPSESDGELRPLSYIVLGLLETGGPMTSYELEHNASISVGFFWPFPHSQIYAEPKRLFAEGLVELEEEDGGRRRKTWSITDDGRRALRAWLARPSDPAQIRDPALLKLFFASADPDAVPAIAKERIARQEHALGFLDRPDLGGLDEHHCLVLAWGRKQVRADLDFWRSVLAGDAEIAPPSRDLARESADRPVGDPHRKAADL